MSLDDVTVEARGVDASSPKDKQQLKQPNLMSHLQTNHKEQNKRISTEWIVNENEIKYHWMRA